MDYPIKPTISARESAKRITNLNAVPQGKLNSERVLIQPYLPNRGYAHHAAMTIFHDRIYAMWSSGRVHEDDCGQRVMWAYSDGFNQWSTPAVFSDAEMGVHSEKIKFSNAFFSCDDKLFAYYVEAEYRQEDMQGPNFRPATNTPWLYFHSYVRALNPDGVSWGDPIEVGRTGCNHSAEKISGGRYMMPTGDGVKFTDQVGDIPVLKETRLAPEVVNAALENHIPLLCEGSFYETDDGILHLLFRTDTYRLWHTESYDRGETLEELAPTEFSDGWARFQFGRLPDGRYYYVGNPQPKPGRLTLELAVSENGYDFNRSWIIRDEPVELHDEGMFKGGAYGYPECVIHHGYMYVIYSKMKEEVEITRFSLDQLN